MHIVHINFQKSQLTSSQCIQPNPTTRIIYCLAVLLVAQALVLGKITSSYGVGCLRLYLLGTVHAS